MGFARQQIIDPGSEQSPAGGALRQQHRVVAQVPGSSVEAGQRHDRRGVHLVRRRPRVILQPHVCVQQRLTSGVSATFRERQPGS